MSLLLCPTGLQGIIPEPKMNGGWRVKTQILAAGKNWIIHEHIEYIEHEQCFKILTFS